eukprot:m.174724 g.174724  ORF g.174724 m.174724 type:complete len:346 (-) comp31782_c1_seq5:201-1238(-)
MSDTSIPIINLSVLLETPSSKWNCSKLCMERCDSIVQASIQHGFFYAVGHGIGMVPLSRSSKRFFELTQAEKSSIRMELAGHSWRGWFGVGEEFTSGKVDQKEGIYFGTEDMADDVRPLRGPNQWPQQVPELKEAVLSHMRQCRQLGSTILSAIATGLGLSTDHFQSDFREPTELFRVFAYPPHDDRHGSDTFAVGEHTDYGYLTMLAQDDSGGLQIKTQNSQWMDAPPVADSFVINLGDALENCTGGLLRATPHRVIKRDKTTKTRFSFPYFYDPGMSAEMVNLVKLMKPEYQEAAKVASNRCLTRWDGTDPNRFRGTYGTYLMKKISKVFPDLAEANLQPSKI